MQNRKRRSIMFLGAVMMTIATYVADGQVQLLGEHLNNPESEELTAINQQSLIYKPTNTNSPVLYFTPFFVFENAPDGTLKVDTSEPIRVGDPWKLILTLTPSPYAIRVSMAAEVRKWAAIHPSYGQYVSTDAQSLIPVELTYLSVAEVSPVPLFKPVTKNGIIAQQPVYLEANLKTEEEAKSTAEKLRKRTAKLTFDVNYRLYARLTISESKVSMNNVSIKSTEGVQSLQGAGRAFKIGVSPTSGTAEVGADQSIITRDQQQSFEARVRNEIAADYVVENSADIEFLDQRLRDYFKSILTEQEISFGDIKQAMTRLSAYNFNALDLSPDKIENLAIEAKNALTTEDQSKVSFSGSASGSVAGFGGSASASFSRDELKKRMQDKGWTFGTGGEMYVPKTFKVYVVQKDKLDSQSTVSINVSRRLREVPSFPATVSTSIGFTSNQKEAATAIVGAIMGFAGTYDAAPSGWLPCDGRVLHRKDYDRLFDVIKYTYGGDPAKEQFQLPDLRGRTAIGAGQGNKLSNRILAESLGEEKHQLTIPEMPQHNHDINDPGHSHEMPWGNTIEKGGVSHERSKQSIPQGPLPTTSLATTGISTKPKGEDQPHNVMQPSLVVNYLIHY